MVSLGTQQDDQPRTGESTVVGAGHRHAQGGAGGRGVGGPGAGSAVQKAAAPAWQAAASWAARRLGAASPGARAECADARSDGHAGQRDGGQEELASRAGEERAAAQALGWGGPCAETLPTQETTPRTKEASATACGERAQAPPTRRSTGYAPGL